MRNDNIIYISYFTKGTIYEDIIEEYLIPSLKKYDLKYAITCVPDTGKWHLNARCKPKIILNALESWKEDIVWIDADAIINSFPTLFHSEEILNYDIATTWLKWEEHYGRTTDFGVTEMLDGTVYFKNTRKVIEFVREWIKAQGEGEHILDHQKVLANMLSCGNYDIKVLDYPREYCYIETLPNGNPPAIPLDNPIISHYQASRIARKQLHKKGG